MLNHFQQLRHDRREEFKDFILESITREHGLTTVGITRCSALKYPDMVFCLNEILDELVRDSKLFAVGYMAPNCPWHSFRLYLPMGSTITYHIEDGKLTWTRRDKEHDEEVEPYPNPIRKNPAMNPPATVFIKASTGKPDKTSSKTK